MSDVRDPSTDQTLPVPNDRPFVQDLVVADVEARKQLGIRKYGTALQSGNGRNMLLDASEEALDLAIYLRGALDEQEREDGTDTECHDDQGYGLCLRDRGHDGEHATFIGGGSDPISDPEVWFVWGGEQPEYRSSTLSDPRLLPRGGP